MKIITSILFGFIIGLLLTSLLGIKIISGVYPAPSVVSSSDNSVLDGSNSESGINIPPEDLKAS